MVASPPIILKGTVNVSVVDEASDNSNNVTISSFADHADHVPTNQKNARESGLASSLSTHLNPREDQGVR
jgi:hypothetical protein